MKGWRRTAAVPLVVLATLLAACSSAPPRPDPTPLQPLVASVHWQSAWQQRLDDIRFGLSVAAVDGVFTVADSDGTVLALRADDGTEVWRAQLDGRIAAGVGSDGRYAAVVTGNGELVTLEAGRVLWRQRLGVQVATAPLVAGERVFVLALDRSVQAFDARGGRRLWTYRQPSDPLTLLHPGVLLPFDDTLLAGQGPRLAGLDPLAGTLRWDTALASPRGTNEVERLADLVGPAARVGSTVCARAFQATVGCVDAARGQVLWTRNVGGINGVAATDRIVVAADASDRLAAWRTASGEPAWSSDRLLYRSLGSPTTVGDLFVIGDGQGIVHWLDGDSGKPVLRMPTDGSATAGAPAWSGRTLLVATRRGGLFAFRPE